MRYVNHEIKTASGENRSEKAIAFINALVGVCRTHGMHFESESFGDCKVFHGAEQSDLSWIVEADEVVSETRTVEEA